MHSLGRPRQAPPPDKAVHAVHCTCDGVESMGPNPPAAVTAQASKATDMATSSGAEYFSRVRMDSMPRITMQI